MSDVPEEHEPWAVALQELYLTRGRPRLRDLGQQSGMSHESVNGYLHGRRKPPLDRLLRLVAALGGDEEVFADLWHQRRAEKPSIPTERELLRDILAELRAIRVTLEARDAKGPRRSR